MVLAAAVVLEKQNELRIRDIELDLEVGEHDVEIEIRTVGICGSDVHFYTHGRIGPFVVNSPMVLGHEASGVVTAIGSEVQNLKIGDRVCMEPGIPDTSSKAFKLGLYNVDPAVRFWATPPVHGCLTHKVVHPAAFTFKLPPSLSFAEGAMVEPFAVAMQAASKAKIQPGDLALVIGAGPIGIMTALAALAGGCSKVFISDVVDQKLEIAAQYDGLFPLNASSADVASIIMEETDNWGADVVLECAGVEAANFTALASVRPGGCLVFVGMPTAPVSFEIVSAQAKEIRMETVFRYTNIYDRTIKLLGAGKVDLKPLISDTYSFEDSILAFDRAVSARPTDVKLQIKVNGDE